MPAPSISSTHSSVTSRASTIRVSPRLSRLRGSRRSLDIASTGESASIMVYLHSLKCGELEPLSPSSKKSSRWARNCPVFSSIVKFFLQVRKF
jgi:hypothetical protein